jgi:hypothetical protein
MGIQRFNLRTTNHLENDTDDPGSNFDSSQIDSAHRNQGSEALLLNDLDLSSRQETVVYKPNPWSIAKINAASRTARPANPIVVCQDQSILWIKQPLKGSVVEGFKKQAERLLPVAPKENVTDSKGHHTAAVKTTANISLASVPCIQDQG